MSNLPDKIELFTADRRARGSAASAEANRGEAKAPNPASSDRVYTAEETEWMRHMEEWMTKTRRKCPSWSEILTLLKGLGYEKPAGQEVRS